MKKLYLAHPISTTGEFNDSIRIANNISDITVKEKNKDKVAYVLDGVFQTSKEDKAYDVYAPALNKEINDKSNNPTPMDIYDQDVERLVESDVVVINYTGGDADGTVFETGFLNAMVEAFKRFTDDEAIYKTAQQFSGHNLHEEEIRDIILEHAMNSIKLPKVIVFSSNQRAVMPQLFNPKELKLFDTKENNESLQGFIPSGKLNAMVIGGIVKNMLWVETEEEMYVALRDILKEDAIRKSVNAYPVSDEGFYSNLEDELQGYLDELEERMGMHVEYWQRGEKDKYDENKEKILLLIHQIIQNGVLV